MRVCVGGGGGGTFLLCFVPVCGEQILLLACPMVVYLAFFGKRASRIFDIQIELDIIDD